MRAKLPEPLADTAVTVPLRPIVSRGAPPPPFMGSSSRAKTPEPLADVVGPVQLGVRWSRLQSPSLPPPLVTQGTAELSALPESDSFYVVRRRFSRPSDFNAAALLPHPRNGRTTRIPGPKQIRRFGDSLRYYFTGAVSDGGAQTDPDASLGGSRSSTEAERLGIIHTSPIHDVSVTFAAGANGPSGKLGSITLLDGNQAKYTAEGGTTPGDAVEIPFENNVLLQDGDTPSKWIRAKRNQAAPMSGSGAVEYSEQFNNVFGLANADNTESGSGGDRYRAVMVRNDSSDVASSIKYYVKPLGDSAVTSAGQLGASGAGTVTGATDAFCAWPVTGWARIEDSGGTLQEIVYYTSRTDTALTVPAAGRGLLGTSAGAGSATDVAYPVPGIRIAWEDAAPLRGGDVQTIASESTAPTGLTWSTAITAATGVAATDLDGGDQGALWIHRELPAGTSASPELHNEIGASFVVDGVTYVESLTGMYRVADTDIELYEIHIGSGSEPDITAAPTETSATLPYTTSTTLSVGTTYYIVTNFRNRYGLVSKSNETSVITIDGSGDQVTNVPTAPGSVTCSVAASGAFEVRAIYYYEADGANAADTWLVYSRFDGTAPVIGVDSPTTSTIAKADGAAVLSHTTATQSDGTVGKFIVRVRRSSDSSDSTNTDVCTQTADATAPDSAAGGLFWRGAGEQEGA